ncbi:hypothetical protein MJG53_001990 [Ovis ammon polii x Ovis aries]|uniref:Uncharacterized protein n=1 Tax=Ovis ammon polii x Ovis aries TaxID=2918886 RepID=A0ACB9VLP8_9CETA|nr:hypothetical protein MJG53_001990 [Ovis ammon polii x Ovis aries]
MYTGAERAGNEGLEGTQDGADEDKEAIRTKQGLQKSEILNSSEQAIPSIPVALHTTQCSRPPNARLQADFASELQSHKSSCLLVSLPRNIFSHDPPFTWPVTGDHSSPCIWSPNSFSSTSAYFCTSTNTSTTDTPVQDTIFCHFPFSNPVAQYILLTADTVLLVAEHAKLNGQGLWDPQC